MAKVNKEDIEHVAQLSRIKLTEDEVEKSSSELAAILDYVDELESAPTENVESIKQISGLENITREDEIEPSLPQEKVLQNAPDKKDSFIKVKQIFE